jgi:signal transduction histidine kinase
METHPKTPVMDRQARQLFVFMVVIGYVITFILILIRGEDGRRLSQGELFWGILLGVIYLLGGLNTRLIFDRLPAGWAEAIFFSVQSGLVFGIGLVLGTDANWLIGVPLAGFAVEELSPRWRWAVYITLIAALVLPIGLRDGSWISALISIATMGAAVFFVAVFAQLRLNEQQARERAERLMEELEEANVQLAAYATQAEELAMTQERNRLAREIHDNLGHTLTIVNVQIEAAKAVMDSDPDRALDAMDKAQGLAKKGLTDVRESVAALRESPVSKRPLSEAIVALVQGLTNVRRHARASRVDVLLDFRPAEVRLEVRDNGVGAAKPSGGFGLLGIRERMQLLGGGLEINTGVGKGFCLTASVPMFYAGRPAQPEE